MCESIRATLKKLSETYRDVKRRRPDEGNTESWFINPFLESLGYPVYNHRLVERQFIADSVGTDSRGDPGAGRVDFAIKNEETQNPIIFIECKRLEANLDSRNYSAFNQLNRYYILNPTVDFAILTNGNEYRFYLGQENPRKLLSTVFISFDLNNFSNDDVKILTLLSKKNYNAEEIRQYVNSKRDREILFEYVKTNVLITPSIEFIKFLSQEVYGNRRRESVEKVKSQLPSILKELVPRDPTPPDDANIEDERELNELIQCKCKLMPPTFIDIFDENFNPTHRNITAYRFEGKEHVAYKWVDMYVDVMKVLFIKNQNLLLSINELKISRGRINSRHKRLSDGYKIHVHSNAMTKIRRLKISLKALQLEGSLQIKIRDN